jgi:hypothetical protein
LKPPPAIATKHYARFHTDVWLQKAIFERSAGALCGGDAGEHAEVSLSARLVGDVLEDLADAGSEVGAEAVDRLQIDTGALVVGELA